MATLLLLGAFLVLLFAGVPVALAMLASSIPNLVYINLFGIPLPPIVVVIGR